MAKDHAHGIEPVDVPQSENLTTRLWHRTLKTPGDVILRTPSNGGWRDVTWGELGKQVLNLAAGLIDLGIKPGDRVALMSPTRMEWTVADLAILAAGGVTVPIYETSSEEQCAWILSDSGAKAAFAADADLAKNLELAREEAPNLGEIFIFDEGGLDELAERADDKTRKQVPKRSQALTAQDTATIVYTSGTTGRPKGCVLTHGNLVWTVRQTEHGLEELMGPTDTTLLFLPLAHSFARLIQFACLEIGICLGYSRGIDKLAEDLKSFKPTFLLSVPRVFEKVFNTAQRKAEGAKAKVFNFAVSTSEAYAKDPGSGKLKHKIADKLVYSKLREAVGGRVRYCVSGGAPLSPHLAYFFHAAGITILEGYGLTETSAPATANTPKAWKFGTVGRPLPGVEVKIADDGEILIRGGNVFPGYYKNKKATKEMIDDEGWLHSGDTGAIDDEGFVSITGRKKELIVTAGGKNVAPAVLEERLKSHRLVSQALVVGDDKPFIATLITLDPDEAKAFAAEHKLSDDLSQLAKSEKVREEVKKAVDHANKAVSRAESIRKFTILDRDFSQEDEELTPTLKVKRRVVAEHFADEIEELYEKA